MRLDATIESISMPTPIRNGVSYPYFPHRNPDVGSSEMAEMWFRVIPKAILAVTSSRGAILSRYVVSAVLNPKSMLSRQYKTYSNGM
jgi:hypothetical protein